MEINKLDVSVFSDTCKSVIIGKLNQNLVDFIIDKKPELRGILKKTNIVLWDNRIEYTEKHKGNFKTPDMYYKYLSEIPNMIKNPDYIGLPPHDSSIQFIKQCENNIVVAIRISTSGGLSYRTMYPITDSQLEDYQRKNRAWKYIDKKE